MSPRAKTVTTVGWGVCWVLTTLPVPQPHAYRRKSSPGFPSTCVNHRFRQPMSPEVPRNLNYSMIINWFLLCHRLLIKCTFMPIWTPVTACLFSYLATISRKKRQGGGCFQSVTLWLWHLAKGSCDALLHQDGVSLAPLRGENITIICQLQPLSSSKKLTSCQPKHFLC